MTLVADASVEMSEWLGYNLTTYPVQADQVIYRGARVGLHAVTGALRAFEPCDIFVGIAYEGKNATGEIDGAIECRVITHGDIVLTVPGVLTSQVGAAVFAGSDSTQYVGGGHPDSFMGRIIRKTATNTAIVRLKMPGERPDPSRDGCLDYQYNSGPVYPTGAVAGNGPVGQWQGYSTLGLGTTLDAAVGGVSGAFDAVAEVAQVSVETPVIFDITNGITFRATLNLEAIGDNAALDIDWGIGNVLNGTTRADMDSGTLTKHCRFHMDGNSANVYAESDDNVTDVAATDTTYDNVLTADSGQVEFVILARPSGICEVWIAGVRRLTSTVFSCGASGTFGGFVNAEKTSDDTVAEFVAKYLRMAGARTVSISEE